MYICIVFELISYILKERNKLKKKRIRIKEQQVYMFRKKKDKSLNECILGTKINLFYITIRVVQTLGL